MNKKDIYEIKNARVIKNNFKKPMKKIILDDNSFIICTYDHKFLLKNNTYLEVKNIDNVSLVPFKRMTTKKGYWEIRKSKCSNCIKKRFNVNTWQDFVELCNNYNHKIKNIENLEGEFDCYDLQVEENNNFAKYINSPETPLYNKSKTFYGLDKASNTIKKENSVILVEGYFDLMQLVQNGIKNVIAISGTSFTDMHASIIKQYTSNIYIAFDGDAAMH